MKVCRAQRKARRAIWYVNAFCSQSPESGSQVLFATGVVICFRSGIRCLTGTDVQLQQLWDDMLQPEARTEAADLAVSSHLHTRSLRVYADGQSFTSWNWDAGLEGLLQTDQGGNIL